jgi:predicted alpha/beta-fold hydrolase
MRVDMDKSFRPSRWLTSRHLQSMAAHLPSRRGWVIPSATPVLRASREMLLDCGEGVRLQAFYAPASGANGRVAVLLHGWEGSADSTYVLALAQQLYDRGFDVLRLNLRDHGATHHLNRELFHSCRLPEVVGAMRRIQLLFPGKPLHLAGFSLGGNFMLRVAAQAEQAGLDLAKVVAISPVLDPVATLAALERGFPLYHWYFVRKWARSLSIKQSAWPRDYDFAALKGIGIRGMTEELVRRFTEFETLADYLNGYAITGSRLAQLSVPATIILSLDDPIIPARDVEHLAPSSALRVVLTRYGGHCGFIERIAGWSWAERRAAAELDAAPLPAAAALSSEARASLRS